MAVIIMTVTGERGAHARALAVGTWIVVAAVPVAWALGIFLAFLSGEGSARGAGSILVGLLGVAVFAAMPTLAVVLAIRLRRIGHPSGRAAAVVSGLLLALTLLVTMLVGTLATIVVVIVMAPLGVYLWHSSSRSGPPVG